MAFCEYTAFTLLSGSDYLVEILEGSDSDHLKYTTSLRRAYRFLKNEMRMTQLKMHWLWHSPLMAAQMSA